MSVIVRGLFSIIARRDDEAISERAEIATPLLSLRLAMTVGEHGSQLPREGVCGGCHSKEIEVSAVKAGYQEDDDLTTWLSDFR